jgi:hypothetical protein
LPTREVPISTLYYRKSLDAKRRHFGISKINIIAMLTLKIIQLLSWTDEDILANLALFVFPGKQPKDDNGDPIVVKLTPFKIIYTGDAPTNAASVLQGETSMIDVKLKIIDIYVREILRLAYMLGASAEAEKVTSGVQGVVARNELFMELGDLANGLDAYVRNILKWAAATATDQPEVIDPPVQVSYYKGPYALDPLKDAIDAATKLIAVFERISPEMTRDVYKQLAAATLYNEDARRAEIFDDIDKGFDAEMQRRATLEAQTQDLLNAANDASAGNPPGIAPAAPGSPTQVGQQ